MTPKFARAMLYALVSVAVVTAGAAYSLTHLSYVPRAPIEISRHFIDLIQAGDIGSAYLLTDRGGSVGSSLAVFEANVRRQMAAEALPSDRSVKLTGTHGFQSYGNRLRRLMMGRKIDPDEVSVDYVIGPGLPFEVRLRSNDTSAWRITYFQSHAG